MPNSDCQFNERLQSHQRDGRGLVSGAGDGRRLDRPRIRRDDRAADGYDAVAARSPRRRARSDSKRMAAISPMARRIRGIFRRVKAEWFTRSDAGEEWIGPRLRI